MIDEPDSTQLKHALDRGIPDCGACMDPDPIELIGSGANVVAKAGPLGQCFAFVPKKNRPRITRGQIKPRDGTRTGGLSRKWRVWAHPAQM